MMSAEDFKRAKAVLEAGRPTHTLYQVEDARQKLAPVRKGYQRLILTTLIAPLLVGLVLGGLLDDVLPAADIWLPTIAIPLGVWAMQAPMVWRRFVPLEGVRFADIQKAAFL